MQCLKVLTLVILLLFQLIQSAHASDDMSHMHSSAPTDNIHTTTPTMRINIIKINDQSDIKMVQVQLVNLKDSKPINLSDLKEVHTQKIHLLIIDNSLQDYIHVHPTALNAPGMYIFDWSPKLKNANYKIWADVTSQKTGEQEYVMTELTKFVKSTNEKINRTTILNNNVSGYNFALQFDHKELNIGKMIMGTIMVTDHNGKPVTTLEPLMGSFAHIVGFYDDGKTMIHIHPLGTEPIHTSDHSGPILTFHMVPSKAGFIKLFVQIKINGKEIYVPFGFTIK